MQRTEIQTATIDEPRFARRLFASKGAAWFWLVARVWLGWQWFVAGWDKVTGTQATGFFNWHLGWGFTSQSWLRDGGAGLKGFAGFAVTNSQGAHPAVSYGWYVSFLKWIENSSHAWLAPIIALGELLIGLALIFGLFVGIAAFFGAMLNLSFGLSGVAGVNPVFFLVEMFLILAWRNAGYYGLDRYVLPTLGTPWAPGKVFHREGSRTLRRLTAPPNSVWRARTEPPVQPGRRFVVLHRLLATAKQHERRGGPDRWLFD